MKSHKSKVSTKKNKSVKTRPAIDKYDLYLKSVQSPEHDIDFVYKVAKDCKKPVPKILREDFGGIGALMNEWVKRKPHNVGYAIDLDDEPMAYGKAKLQKRMSKRQIAHSHYLHMNVLSKDLPKADVVLALNFSYFIFKTRELMKKYFKNVHRTMNKNGIFILDVFGGSQCQDEIVDKIIYRNFTYYWDQTGYDPVTHEATFHIHFKVGKTRFDKAFTYNWRMWSLLELKELLLESGFKNVNVYWEGTKKDGSGDGVFKRVTHGEACLSWVAYLVAEK